MKSRTSFFNGTVLKKDITRFAPVWALYALLLLLRLPGLFETVADRVRSLANYEISSLSTINIFYAFICGAMLFGDLFKAPTCNALHALPLRREGWFLTHCTAGLLFSFVPNLLYALLSMLYVPGYWYVPLAWLAVNTLQFLFFFGLTAFSAMCVGSRLGLAAVYFTCNFLAVLIGEYINEIYIPLLHGIEMDTTLFQTLTPMMQMGKDYLDINVVEERILFHGIHQEVWIYTGIAAAVGIGFGIIALLLYRKRNLECAGDFIALKAAKPVFLVIFTLMAELVLYITVYIPLLGMVVGYFCCRMLQERTVKVFKWKFIWRLLVLVGLYIISMVVTWADPVGITRYVPELDQIEAVSCYENTKLYEYSNEGVARYVITDPEEIERYRQFHSKLTAYRTQETDSSCTQVSIVYQLKNGTQVTRRYTVDVESQLGQQSEKLFSSWQYIFQTDDWEQLQAKVTQIVVYPENATANWNERETMQLTGEQARQLLEAIRADCEAGTMAQNWAYRMDQQNMSSVGIYTGNYSDYTYDLNIMFECTNTVAYIRSITE